MAVETYGGGLWHTWFDRDLSLAGRVIVGDPSTGKFRSKLVKIDRPLLRIPTLAIHLDRGAADNFKFNTESEFVPILGQSIASQLNAIHKHKEDKNDEAGTHENTHNDNVAAKHEGRGLDHSANHHTALLQLLASELSVKPEEVNDFELYAFNDYSERLAPSNCATGNCSTCSHPVSGASVKNSYSLLV